MSASPLTREKLGWACLGLLLAAASGAAQVGVGAANVGASATSTVTLTVPKAVKLGGVAVVTQGAAGLDFTNAGTGSCVAGMNYAAGQTCTVDVTFKPLYAGMRYGAALLKDQAGAIVAGAGLMGVGIGPQVAFTPAAAMAIAPVVNGTVIGEPFGVTVDAAGDLYMTDTVNGRVLEIPAGGGAPVSLDPVVDGMALDTPGGVLVDGAGNLFISDLENNNVVEVPADGSAPIAIDPAPNGLAMNYPCGMAVDTAGDLYIADVDNGRVVEVPAGGGAALALDPVVNGKALIYPVALALDRAGDLYIADEFGNQVVEVPAGGGAAIAIAPTAGGKKLYWPYGIALDAAGDLFIADALNRVIEVPAGGGAATSIAPVVDGKGLNDPVAIALDGAGNLFIGDTYNNRVIEVERSLPPALGFAASSVGSASSDSPRTVTLENDGNAVLEFPAPASGANPAIAANFLLDSSAAGDCPLVNAGAAAPGTLAAGTSCQLPVSFQPAVGGSVAGTLAITDNHLNAAGPAYATQNIVLTGDAPMAAVSAPSLWFGAQVAGQASASQSVTLTNPGGAPLAITSIAVTGTGAASFSFPNACGASIAAGASCTLAGSFKPSGSGAAAATLTIADNAAGSPHTVALNGAGVNQPAASVAPSAGSVSTAQAFSVTATVNGASGQPQPTGWVTITIAGYVFAPVALSGGTATLNVAAGAAAVGTDVIKAGYAPDAASSTVYAAATATGQIEVTQAAAPAASTGAASAVTYNGATVAATIDPNGADTHVWFLYGTSSTLSGASQSAQQDVGSGSAAVNATANLTGLNASTMYYYQVVAQNSLGTKQGAMDSFTTPAAPSFSMTATAITIAPGAAAGNTSTVTITPAGGFTGTVSLSCSIAPLAASDPASCSVPATVTISGGSAQTVTLTVNSTAAVASSPSGSRLWPTGGGAVLACLLLFGARKRRVAMFMALLMVAGAFTGCACGNCNGGGHSNPGTTPGVYTVTVTGVAGSMTTTATAVLTVE